MPPLRERREDVLGLANAFLKTAQLSPTAAEALLLHDWPFNVRELENLMVNAALRATEGVIRAEHLPPALARRVAHRIRPPRGETSPPPLESLIDRSRAPNRDELAQVLSPFDGSIALVTDFFGKDRRQVYRWLERLGLDANAARPESGPVVSSAPDRRRPPRGYGAGDANATSQRTEASTP